LKRGLFANAMSLMAETGFVEIIGLAAQMLYSSHRDTKDPNRPLMDHLPVDQFYHAFVTEADERVIGPLLTFFTNFVALGSAQVSQVLREERAMDFLNVMYSLLETAVKPEIRNGVEWCLWNVLRNAHPEQQLLVFGFRDGSLFEMMLDSFESDDVDFLRNVLIPSLIGFTRAIQGAGLESQGIFGQVMAEIEPRLTRLCYREDSPEIQSLATSCLKNSFPQSYEREKFC
jgi:hypothetical protein